MLLRRSVHAAAQRQRSVDIRSLIVHEDNHVLIANKPSGLLSQQDRTCDSDLRSLVLSYLPTAYASLVHRLDRPASGCVIVAKTSKAAARLGAAFRARQVRKLYLAIVQGQPHESAAWLIDAMRAPPDAQRRSGAAIVDKYKVVPCKRRPDLLAAATTDDEPPASALDAQERALRLHGDSGSQIAMLRYDVLHYDGMHSLLAVELHTGRRHQVRAQLAAHGHSIVGDRRYGPKLRAGSTRTELLALHAAMIRVQHPVQDRGELYVTAPIPSAWSQLCSERLFGKLLRLWKEAFEPEQPRFSSRTLHTTKTGQTR